jgi:hypothetical protein
MMETYFLRPQATRIVQTVYASRQYYVRAYVTSYVIFLFLANILAVETFPGCVADTTPVFGGNYSIFFLFEMGVPRP